MKTTSTFLNKILTFYINTVLLVLLVLNFSVLHCQAETKEQRVYFIASTSKSWQIFQVHPSGIGLIQTLATLQDVVKLSLTPDIKKILCITSDQDFFLFDINSRKKMDIAIDHKGTVDAILSNDNKFLLFSLSTGGANDANHIWLTEMASNKTTQLTHMKGMQHGPIWSHDDKSIFFLSGSGGQNEDIWRLDVENGSLNQLTAGQLYNFELSCSPDDELAFSSNRSGDYEIWTMDPFGGNVRQLTHSPGMDSQPSWSPDGEYLVFVSNRDGYPALYIMDREGKNSRRISPEGLVCRNPVWGR